MRVFLFSEIIFFNIAHMFLMMGGDLNGDTCALRGYVIQL